MALKNSIISSGMAQLLLFAFLLITSACHRWQPTTEYNQFYAHLIAMPQHPKKKDDSAFFLKILVDAKHLDYTNTCRLLETIAKHPNGSKERDFGHAWIHLHGEIDGTTIDLEGGHSGELGISQAKYFDGVMQHVEHHHPNPICYLWETLNDGFFQPGGGHHTPTFTATFALTEQQFRSIYNFVCYCYNFKEYALTTHQCTSFVAQVAALAGIPLETDITIKIPQKIYFGGRHLPLWRDSCYKTLTFPTPDILEKSLMMNSEFRSSSLD